MNLMKTSDSNMIKDSEQNNLFWMGKNRFLG